MKPAPGRSSQGDLRGNKRGRKENRGTLHEDQYRRRVEELVSQPAELRKVKGNQQKLRVVHKGYSTALVLSIQVMREKAKVLEGMLTKVLVELATVTDNDLRNAIMSNVVFAEILVREMLGRKLEECLNELTIEPTKGADEVALAETFELLLKEMA